MFNAFVLKASKKLYISRKAIKLKKKYKLVFRGSMASLQSSASGFPSLSIGTNQSLPMARKH
jgi:hypothetical protein